MAQPKCQNRSVNHSRLQRGKRAQRVRSVSEMSTVPPSRGRRRQLLYLTLLLVCEVPTAVVAPKGAMSSAAKALAAAAHSVDMGFQQPGVPRSQQANSTSVPLASTATAVAAAAGVAFAAAAAARAANHHKTTRFRTTNSGMPSSSSCDGCRGDETHMDELSDDVKATASACEECADNEDDASVGDADDSAEAQADKDETGSAPARRARKLWSNILFPEGVNGPENYELGNLIAVHETWLCPCSDRESCLSSDRVNLTALYEYRKKFRTQGKSDGRGGGYRDSFRRILEQHYSRETNSFSRSFVIGKLNDCCAASAGLASGLSFQTFAQCRADVTRSRPYHSQRTGNQDRLESDARSSIEGYILDLRSTMEGDKGGLTAGVLNYHTCKRTSALRWEDYKASQTQAGLPCRSLLLAAGL
eukprot:6214813-Pleurochrysis_carterae.AAC.3